MKRRPSQNPIPTTNITSTPLHSIPVSLPFLFRFFYFRPVIMSQTVVLKVGMSCGGCSGAVKRVLDKMEGVESFDIDLKEQKVTVKGNVQPEAVLQTVSKTGKKTSFWEAEAASEPEAKPAEVVAVA
uniref:HMA domain-containing protein n=1 Tax=Davidia involucrata TaxID=16924 RepID=A0A5B6ZYM0_DAVIN